MWSLSPRAGLTSHTGYARGAQEVGGMNLNNGGYSMPDDHIEPDMPPMEYTDHDGLHVMCACGHYVSGAVKPGDHMAIIGAGGIGVDVALFREPFAEVIEA